MTASALRFLCLLQFASTTASRSTYRTVRDFRRSPTASAPSPASARRCLRRSPAEPALAALTTRAGRRLRDHHHRAVRGGRRRPHLLQRAHRQRALPAHRARAQFAAAADAADRLSPAPRPRRTDHARLHPRRRRRDAHPQGPEGDERPGPGRAAADLRDDRADHRPRRHQRPAGIRASRRSSTFSGWAAPVVPSSRVPRSWRSTTGLSSSGWASSKKRR